MIDWFVDDASGGFVLPVLEYGSAVWCLDINTYFKLLDCVVSEACFLTGSN